MEKPIIKVSSLHFSFDKEELFHDVNLEIMPGEFVGVFGPNGGGKTTFLKLLLKLENPSKGSVEINLNKESCNACQIAYMPQVSRFDKQFPITVLEVVLMGLLHETGKLGRYTKEHKEKAKAALEKVGLAHLETHRFGDLSGGQAQRALFARALVSDPTILILDEPTASIDPQAVEMMQKLIDEQIGKKTILMVTHDLDKIENKISRALCVYKGVTSYKPNEVCGHLKSGLYHPKEER